MRKCDILFGKMEQCHTSTRRGCRGDTLCEEEFLYQNEAKWPNDPKWQNEAEWKNEAKWNDDTIQSKGWRLNCIGFRQAGNDRNHKWKTNDQPDGGRVDHPDKTRTRGSSPPIVLSGGQLEIRIDVCDNRIDCKALSEPSDSFTIGSLSKRTKLESFRTESRRGCSEKAPVSFKITRRFPTTFPSVFTHCRAVLLCLILILTIFGPHGRRIPGEGGLPGGGLLFADAYSSTYNPKDFSRNVTQLLDALMADYDKRIRPGYGGPPTKIMVNMNVRSMGPFSEKKEEYAMQLYMRQVWYDSRLRFNKTDLGRSTFSMNWMFAEKIWKPDTFFINGKKSYAHAITAPNMFVRLQHDGQIYMSMRLTVRASCIMHLRRFPLDTQTCPLRLASYGYNAKDIMFEWDPTKMVTVDSDVSIAQYELVNVTFSEAIVPVRRIEKISTLTVKFHLTRLTGFFMLQVYVPCILIVCSSWVGFWITKKDPAGRVCLGVTTVLAMVTLGFGGRNAFPEVAYATALDYFVILCLAFLFAAVIEFACINFLERRANKRRKKMEDLKKKIVEQLSTEGAGCIKVTPSIHTSILESFKVHLMVSPAATRAANTNKPRKPDPKGKLLQALKLPLTVVPKVADEADTGKAEISLDHSHDHHHHIHLPFHLPHHHHHDEATSPHTSSDTESSGSLSPKPYTPRLLQRLAVLQRRLSSHDLHEDNESMPGSQRSSPQPSVQGSPLPSRPPLPPLPPIPGQTPPPGTSDSPPSIQDSLSQTQSVVISGQETPQMSPRISPLTTSAQSALPSPTITTTPPAMVTSAGGPPGGPPALSPGGEPPQAGAAKPEGIIVKVESAGDQPPPPPPAQKHTVTVWQLLIRKKYLMKHMTPTFELPGEEDLLDRFSIIDFYSRRIFPTFFFILFTIYWVLFNYYITDEFPHEPRIPSDGLVN